MEMEILFSKYSLILRKQSQDCFETVSKTGKSLNNWAELRTLSMKDLFSGEKNSQNEENILLTYILEEISNLKSNISSGSNTLKTSENDVFEEKKNDSYYYAQEKLLEEPEPLEEEESIPDEPTTGYILIREPKKTQNRRQYGVEALEQEAIATVTKNKKQIIKQKIVAIASKNRITAKQIKEIIVDKHRYCSKATYYRYLAELKAQRRLDTITVNDREYVCNVSLEQPNRDKYNL